MLTLEMSICWRKIKQVKMFTRATTDITKSELEIEK